MMDANEIAARRINSQRLTGSGLEAPREAVAWLGAVQSQEFGMAKWALALRLKGATDAQIEQAYAAGEILRTHVLRPTWHFVTPEDVRWLLALTGQRVIQSMAGRYRQLELDEATLRQSLAVFTRTLSGGQALTRDELRSRLEAQGVSVAGQRMAHILMHAELSSLLVSGLKQGKQHTYMLLEERVPPFSIPARDEALGELTWRYFRSHGPATVRDFCWWSGLTAVDARAGIAMNSSRLFEDSIHGKACWYAQPSVPATVSRPAAVLLPVFDELIVGHTERGALLERLGRIPPGPRGIETMQNLLLIDGQIVGGWSRIIHPGKIEVNLALFTVLTETERVAAGEAIRRFGEFFGLPVDWKVQQAPD